MSPPDEPPTASLNGAMPSTAADPTPPDPFDTWPAGGPAGRYHLTEDDLHQSGGLGQVFKVRDPVVGRWVAVKTLRPDRANDSLRRRFVREAEITGQLEHPNIVPLYDLLATPDGPAYVMRFVDGLTLAQAARDFHKRRAKGLATPLDLPRLLGAVVLVCEAVAYAHSRGFVHRDLKGQNVLLGPFGEVCLADWGLGKRIGEPDRPGDPHPLSPADDPALTEPGAVMGTPQFMARELARGEPAGVATDVYALGAVLYQVLTDTTPHTGTTSDEVLSSLRNGDPVPPARAVNPATPPALAAICHKALDDDPARRYGSARALAADLQAYLAGEPVGAYPEPLPDRAWRLARKYRGWASAGVAAVLVAAVAAGVGGGLLYLEQQRTARERDRAAEALALLLNQTALVTEEAHRTESGRRRLPAQVVVRRQAVAQAVQATQRVLALLPDDPTQRRQLARLMRYSANLALVVDDLETAERGFAAAAGVWQELAERNPDDTGLAVSLAHLRLDQAALAARRGRYADARRDAQQAADVADGLAGSAEARRASARGRLLLSEALARLGQPGPAAEAAAAAAAGFADLAASPVDRHPHDAALQALALLSVAEVSRPADRAAAADQAVAVCAAAAADPDAHPDLRQIALWATVARAGHRLDAGQTADASELGRAVDGLGQLVQADPGVPAWRRNLAVALVTRERAKPSGPPGPGLAEAERLLAKLTEPATAEPGVWADRAKVWAETARRLPPGEECRAAAERAAGYARKAAALAPADPRLAALCQELEGVIGR